MSADIKIRTGFLASVAVALLGLTTLIAGCGGAESTGPEGTGGQLSEELRQSLEQEDQSSLEEPQQD